MACNVVYNSVDFIAFISERQLRYVRYMPSPVRLSVCLSVTLVQ